MGPSQDTQPLDILSAADLFASSVDEDGFMPGDDGYKEPVVEDADDVEEDEDEDLEDDESEDDEDSDEDEDDSEDDEGSDKKDPEPDETLFELKIGEDVYEVNEEELKAGYLRNESYVGRTTELEREYQSKFTELSEREVQIEAELDALLGLQTQELQRFRGTNWEELKVVDPQEYQKQRLDYIEAQERVNIFNSRKQQLQVIHKQSEQVRQQAYLEEQQALAAKLIPELSDKDFQAGLIGYAKEIGYTEEEVRGIADARHLMLLNQARLYAQSQVRRKEALEKKVPKEVPKVAKPGTPQAPGKAKSKTVKAARERFSKAGDVRTAANYFAQLDIFN